MLHLLCHRMPIIVNLDVMIAPGDNLEHVKKKLIPM